VTLAIFGLAGGIVGMFVGGLVPAAFGLCLGLAVGGFAGPAVISFGYVLACAAMFYGAAACYSTAALPSFAEAQTASVTRSLPPGSSYDRVYTYLKVHHAGNIMVSRSPRTTGAVPSTLVADYNTRFLLGSIRFHTKFQFDRHARLTHCWIKLLA
jgi:hypothetical protein